MAKNTPLKDTVVDPVLLEKTMVSGRVPKYVKKYAEDHDLPISDLVMAGFDAYRERDAEHAIERLRYHENRVIHWKEIVIHNDALCNTELAFCNTVREEFKKQGRGHPSSRRQDEMWLIPRVRRAQAEGYKITLQKLYDFCITEENNGGKK